MAGHPDTLGDARPLSHLGEPLRVSIPLRPDGAGPIGEGCVAIGAPAQSDGLPHILTAHVAVERHGAAQAVTVTTADPVREPLVGLTLRTGCDGRSRLYTLFLEPAGAARQITAFGAKPERALMPKVADQGFQPATFRAVADLRPAAGSAEPSGDAAIVAPDAAALQAENLSLRVKVAQLTEELQRLQQAFAANPGNPSPEAVAAGIPRWEMAWPLGVALAGLVALLVAMWRRRRSAEDWPLTGPPSHRVASRTRLDQDPVPFRQAGIATEPAITEVPTDIRVPAFSRGSARSGASPVALALQPSAEELGRELEQELFVAERAHSALERAHPDVVELLTRSWGTATARNQLTTLLQTGSSELTRMSGEVVAELRLLLRIAEELAPRAPTGDPAAASLSSASV